MSAERELRETLDRLDESGAGLRARDDADLVSKIAEAWNLIGDPERALGRAAREHLPSSSGLSLPMVAWSLSHTLRDVDAELAELARQMSASPGTRRVGGRLGTLVLAGNVFTACVQPLSVALLSRTPTLVKASRKDDALPRLFHAALAQVDAELSESLAIVTLDPKNESLQSTLFSRSDVVSVYGSDQSVAQIRARLPATTSLAIHGHGLGVGFVEREAVESEQAIMQTADSLALDVAAYDQRGCMSPHAIFCERSGSSLAVRLAEALERLGRELPRGALRADVGAAQLTWRGVAASRGELYEGEGFAVAYEASGPLRISPGWRNVLVLDVEDERALARGLRSLGAHLKTIGVAGSTQSRLRIAESLEPPLAPRICAAGAMQRPRLTDLADGRAPWDGWLRYALVG